MDSLTWKWRNLTTVDSLAVHPDDPNVLYVAAGSSRWGSPHDVLKTTDGGKTWARTYLKNAAGKDVISEGNGPDKQAGERLCVDPNQPDTVYFASRNDGLFITRNGAKSWQSPASFPVRGAEWTGITFIGNYSDFGPETIPQLCDEQGVMTSCGPPHYKPEKNALFLNKGKGVFRDASREWGVGKSTGKALGAMFAPLDASSAYPSLYLANDEMPGDLMHNSGGKFDNVGAESGSAYDLNGNVHGGMGLDWDDFDNDGHFDLFVSTFQRGLWTYPRYSGLTLPTANK